MRASAARVSPFTWIFLARRDFADDEAGLQIYRKIRARIRRSINSEISLYRCKWDTLKLNYAHDRLLINESKRPGTGRRYGGEGGGRRL